MLHARPACELLPCLCPEACIYRIWPDPATTLPPPQARWTNASHMPPGLTANDVLVALEGGTLDTNALLTALSGPPPQAPTQRGGGRGHLGMPPPPVPLSTPDLNHPPPGAPGTGPGPAFGPGHPGHPGGFRAGPGRPSGFPVGSQLEALLASEEAEQLLEMEAAALSAGGDEGGAVLLGVLEQMGMGLGMGMGPPGSAAAGGGPASAAAGAAGPAGGTRARSSHNGSSRRPQQGSAAGPDRRQLQQQQAMGAPAIPSAQGSQGGGRAELLSPVTPARALAAEALASLAAGSSQAQELQPGAYHSSYSSYSREGAAPAPGRQPSSSAGYAASPFQQAPRPGSSSAAEPSASPFQQASYQRLTPPASGPAANVPRTSGGLQHASLAAGAPPVPPFSGSLFVGSQPLTHSGGQAAGLAMGNGTAPLEPPSGLAAAAEGAADSPQQATRPAIHNAQQAQQQQGLGAGQLSRGGGAGNGFGGGFGGGQPQQPQQAALQRPASMHMMSSFDLLQRLSSLDTLLAAAMGEELMEAGHLT